MRTFVACILLAAFSCHGQDGSGVTNKVTEIDRDKDGKIDIRIKTAQVKDYQVYRVAQAAISHSRPVSFSVGYPNGWTLSDYNRTQPGDLHVPDDEIVCAFHSPPSHDWADITIWRASDGTAQEEAEAFARDVRQNFSTYSQKRFDPIKTKAGDAGYLVAFEGHFDTGNLLVSDLFFHVGAKGAIRISIMTRAQDSTLHESLQKLVLETLHFRNG